MELVCNKGKDGGGGSDVGGLGARFGDGVSCWGDVKGTGRSLVLG